jgi:hypothetical protein
MMGVSPSRSNASALQGGRRSAQLQALLRRAEQKTFLFNTWCAG